MRASRLTRTLLRSTAAAGPLADRAAHTHEFFGGHGFAQPSLDDAAMAYSTVEWLVEVRGLERQRRVASGSPRFTARR